MPKRSLENAGKRERVNAAKTANARERNIAKHYLSSGPNIINLARAAYHWYNSVPWLGGQNESGLIINKGDVPTPVMRNPKTIVDGIKNTNKYIKLVKESTKMQNYAKVGKRYSESQDIMSDSWPIVDILHLKIPDGTHSSLGIGNYYRAIGNRKGLKSVIENGVVAPKGQFSEEGKVFWNDGYLDRTYSGKGIFALSYDKSGKAHFYPGNKPQKTYVYSSNNQPIDFYDEALGIHARIPFTQTYKEIPKTQKGIDYALKLDKINRYVEKPAHFIYNFGVKPYIGYKIYNNINNKKNGRQK